MQLDHARNSWFYCCPQSMACKEPCTRTTVRVAVIACCRGNGLTLRKVKTGSSKLFFLTQINSSGQPDWRAKLLGQYHIPQVITAHTMPPKGLKILWLAMSWLASNICLYVLCIVLYAVHCAATLAELVVVQ
jgi:hypothetical protein